MHKQTHARIHTDTHTHTQAQIHTLFFEQDRVTVEQVVLVHDDARRGGKSNEHENENADPHGHVTHKHAPHGNQHSVNGL